MKKRAPFEGGLRRITCPEDVAKLVNDPDFNAIVAGRARQAHLRDGAEKDIAQDIFVIFLQKLNEKKPITENALARASMIARNKAFEEMRREIRGPKHLENLDLTQFGFDAPSRDEDECTMEVMAFFYLPEEQRHAGYPEFYGVTLSELAERRGISNATMTARKKHARKLLRYIVDKAPKPFLRYEYLNFLKFSLDSQERDLRLPGTDICPALDNWHAKLVPGNRLLYRAWMPNDSEYAPYFTVEARPHLSPFESIKSEITWTIERVDDDAYDRTESLYRRKW